MSLIKQYLFHKTNKYSLFAFTMSVIKPFSVIQLVQVI